MRTVQIMLTGLLAGSLLAVALGATTPLLNWPRAIVALVLLVIAIREDVWDKW